MSGRIDWSANVVNAENINNVGLFAPPSTWEELKLSLLDILMPANSVEGCAIKLATFKTEKGETVSASALRFRALMSRFESAVERHAKGRTPWAAITVTLWQHSLPRRTNLSVMGSVRVRPDNNKKTTAWHSSRLACKTHPFSLFFSSRRVQISGFVEDYPGPAITVDTATDVSVVSHTWLISQPTLRSVIYSTCRTRSGDLVCC